MSYVIRVKLAKRSKDGLGFLLQERKMSPSAVIQHILPGGAAEESNLVRVGDLIQAINDIDVSKMPFDCVVDMMNNIPAGNVVVLLLRCQEGCRTFLETKFQSNGIPFTERICERLENNDGRNAVRYVTTKKIANVDEAEIAKIDRAGVLFKTPPLNNNTIDEVPEKKVNGAVPLENRGMSVTKANGKITTDTIDNGMSITDNPKAKSRKYCTLRNMMDDKLILTDTLYQQAIQTTQCSTRYCKGSIMYQPFDKSLRTKEELQAQAEEFLDQYYVSIKRYDTPAHQARRTEVCESIALSGSYQLTNSELVYGAKTAWRNASRCIGRMQWSKLQLFDARHITTARGMFDSLCTHLKYATNKGIIRSAITIFPQKTDGSRDYRVWNKLLISYAGYKQVDGSVIGDPANVEFTEICQKLGWKGKAGMFDVLPLVLQAAGQDPELFEIPKELILEVAFKHPGYPWFEELGYRWYAVPAVSNMKFDCGGLEFIGTAFNGWYMVTEIAGRDLCDINRYNILETVAKKMGLNTSSNASLWKDRTLVEVNFAVLHSFQEANVTITDHHSASESFMKHLENEQRARGGCPADWVWIVPPMSSSITPVFHQEMLNYCLRPSYEYQQNPWETHVWKKEKSEHVNINSRKLKKKFKLKDVARAVRFTANLMNKALAQRVKCTILYATETGRAQNYAKVLCEIFNHAFDAKVFCMEDYDIFQLEHETLVLFITSTFGNGDPPDNGEIFSKDLFKLGAGNANLEFRDYHNGEKNEHARIKALIRTTSKTASVSSSLNSKQQVMRQPHMEEGPSVLASVRYSVFGLGSRAYPNFCAFAHFLDHTMESLGAEKVCYTGEGNELCGQEDVFNEWTQEVFKASCETFCVGDDESLRTAKSSLTKNDQTWTPTKYRLILQNSVTLPTLVQGLGKLHKKEVYTAKLISKTCLQAPDSDRQTILVKIDVKEHLKNLKHKPGDHLAIFAANRKDIVDSLWQKLDRTNVPGFAESAKLEILQETSTAFGIMTKWIEHDRLPLPLTLRRVFTYYLDITSPPSLTMLQHFASLATDETERETLLGLVSDTQTYEDWRYTTAPNLVEFLDTFPSVVPPITLLLTHLPLLTYRYYSISSSMDAYPGEIHATVAVVWYKKQGGNGQVHHGVCSTWLDSLQAGDEIPCFVREAKTFHLPEDPTVPVILVGPGTGIAPFRSFWQQRAVDIKKKQTSSGGKPFGEMILYFGCRYFSKDNIYKTELEDFKLQGALKDVFIALSREPGTPKTYVQHLLKQHAKEIYDILVNKEGHLYVCGDVSMAEDVGVTLENLTAEQANISEGDAQKYIMSLRESNRFHEDIFGVTLRTSEVTLKNRESSKKIQKLQKEATVDFNK